MFLPIQKTKKKTNKKFSETGSVTVAWVCHWVAIALDPASLLSQVLMMFYSTDQLCTADSLTYNPLISAVDLRITRSLLTASERSIASGITTGIIGTTACEKRS